MASIYTIDASVFLNAFNTAEPGQKESADFLESVRAEAAPIAVPTLLFPEVAAAIARGRDDANLARAFAAQLARFPGLVSVALDNALAREASDVAATHRLRGSDAVYAAVALRFGSVLVTRDREQRERLQSVLTTRFPDEVLSERGR